MKSIKNKRGFTLVELLVVIAIIGVLLAIIFPSVTNLLNRNKNKTYEYHEKSVLEAAKLYYQQSVFSIKDWNGCYTVPIDNLKNEGLLKELTGDNGTCSGDVQISKDETTKKMSYGVVMECKKDGKVVYNSDSSSRIDNCDSLVVNDDIATPKEYFAISESASAGYISISKFYQQDPPITDVIIPYEINGKKVDGIIGYAFEAANIAGHPVTSVTLPEGLSYIGAHAFDNANLTTLTIPSTVTSISETGIGINNSSNPKLTRIINKTGRSFDWAQIINDHNATSNIFETGTITASNGTVVEITK